MKNAAKVFNGWFWAWMLITVVMVVGMLIAGQPYANGMAAVIMSTFMVLPVRNWLYRFIVWALDYVSSINTNFKDRINPHATYNRLVDPSKREENVGFYRTLKVVIGVICTILALLWLVFQKTSFNVVYAWLHTIEFIFRGRISWLALLFYVLLTLAYIYLVYWFIGQVLTGALYDGSGRIDWASSWWKIVIAVVGFYAKIIISGLLLSFTGGMIWSSVVFWTVVVGFPLLVFEIYSFIRRIRGGTP